MRQFNFGKDDTVHKETFRLTLLPVTLISTLELSCPTRFLTIMVYIPVSSRSGEGIINCDDVSVLLTDTCFATG